MYEFKYEIRLNDNGRPYIHIADDYKEQMEDKFMALEITRCVLYDIIEKRTLPQDTITEFVKALNVVEKLSDKVAELVKGQMDVLDIVKSNILKKYDFEIETLLGRDNIPIGKRLQGLRVLVSENQKIYILSGGIGNNHWTELN